MLGGDIDFVLGNIYYHCHIVLKLGFQFLQSGCDLKHFSRRNNKAACTIIIPVRFWSAHISSGGLNYRFRSSSRSSIYCLDLLILLFVVGGK